MKKLTPKDVIKVQRKGAERTVLFPVLTVCSGCHRPASLLHENEEVKDPQLAYEVHLIQFGHQIIGRFDNSPCSGPCRCEEELLTLREAFSKLPVMEDSGWERDGGNSRRGITDWVRTIEFVRPLTSEELAGVVRLLQKDECPGWTGVRVREYPGTVYHFTTTWDSSD